MIGAVIVSLIGIVFVVLGFLIWKKERISLLHDYHYDQVPESDKKAFCKLSGIGILIIGISLLLTAVILAITDSAWSFIAFAIGFVIGVGMQIHAGSKYNRK